MTIRLATSDDIGAIVEMGAHFIASVYPTDLPFNAGVVETLARQLIDSPDGDVFLAVTDDAIIGMLALTAYLHPMSGERIVTEVCWWVEPSHRGVGLRLFRAAEAWSVQHGAAVFQMIAPSPQVAAFYERVGFKSIETTYQRRMVAP